MRLAQHIVKAVLIELKGQCVGIEVVQALVNIIIIIIVHFDA